MITNIPFLKNLMGKISETTKAIFFWSLILNIVFFCMMFYYNFKLNQFEQNKLELHNLNEQLKLLTEQNSSLKTTIKAQIDQILILQKRLNISEESLKNQQQIAFNLELKILKQELENINLKNIAKTDQPYCSFRDWYVKHYSVLEGTPTKKKIPTFTFSENLILTPKRSSEISISFFGLDVIEFIEKFSSYLTSQAKDPEKSSDLLEKMAKTFQDEEKYCLSEQDKRATGYDHTKYQEKFAEKFFGKKK